MRQLKYTIRTLSPVVMSALSNSTVMTTTHNEFSGSIMRGVLASRYVDNRQLNRTAHADEEFLRLFYGGLKFLPATPDCDGLRSFMLPLSLQKGKAGTENESDVQDLFVNDAPPPGYKSLRGYGVIVDDKIKQPTVEKNIFMHMSRNSDAERLAGRSVEGHIFNYESISEGQQFDGVIVGDGDLLQRLLDGLRLDGNEMIAHIGRSHFTQYGRCRITFEGINDIKQPTVGGKIFLRLETPLVPTNDCFISADAVLSTEIIDKLNRSVDKNIFSIGKIFSAATEIENFVVPWSMKRPRVSALDAGSVFELKTSQPLSDEQTKKLFDACLNGFGQRTEEGFGQLRFRTPATLRMSKKSAPSKDTRVELSKATVERAKKILLNHCLEQIRIYAHEDADELRPQLKHFGNLTHFFGRLDGIIRDTSEPSALAQRLELEIRDGSLFEEHIKNIKMSNGSAIFDVLKGAAPLPYKDRDLRSDLMSDRPKFDALLKELGIDDFNGFIRAEFFREYMQNYFRFARKLAADGGDE